MSKGILLIIFGILFISISLGNCIEITETESVNGATRTISMREQEYEDTARNIGNCIVGVCLTGIGLRMTDRGLSLLCVESEPEKDEIKA